MHHAMHAPRAFRVRVCVALAKRVAQPTAYSTKWYAEHSSRRRCARRRTARAPARTLGFLKALVEGLVNPTRVGLLSTLRDDALGQVAQPLD